MRTSILRSAAEVTVNVFTEQAEEWKGPRVETVQLREIGRDAWTRALEAMDDAGLAHYPHWLDYMRAYLQGRLQADIGVAVRQGDEILAICPAFLEREHSGENARLVTGLGGAPFPFPASNARRPTSERVSAVERALRKVLDAARGQGAASATVRIAPSAASIDPHNQRWVSALREGGLETVFFTQILDLSLSEDVLWRAIRKGHRHDIKRSEADYSVTVHHGPSLSERVFQHFRHLHQKAAGRVTRHPDTWRVMETWVRTGHSALAQVHLHGEPVAYSFIDLCRWGAYYSVACRDPAAPNGPGQHLAQWELIKWLRNQKVPLYDVGEQIFGPQFSVPADVKARSISRFKSGFGGRLVRCPTAEFHFDKGNLRRVLDTRRNAILEGGDTLR